VTGRLDIDSAYALRPDAPAFYRENGFVKLPEVLSADGLRHFGPELTARVAELNTLRIPMEERSTYEKAFLQVMNLWTKSETVRQFVFGKRLARIATELMGTRGVRLYHDQALYKEAGGGLTPWHADQYYWPMETDRCCTAWVPLQDTPFEMGPLAFAPRSHLFEAGRDLEISDESEAAVGAALEVLGFGQFEEPFRLGDVSFHSGWTFHRAGPNRTDRCREVMTVIYMDVDMRLSAPRNKNQVVDRETWCPGAVVGERIETPLNPVLYEAGSSRSSLL
jgi:ectoine hydroxylase-related dioxygenase (phytanoyl-CoA dioxygenase family)